MAHLIAQPDVHIVVINLVAVVGLEQGVDDQHRDTLQDEGGEEVHVDVVPHAVQLAAEVGSCRQCPCPDPQHGRRLSPNSHPRPPGTAPTSPQAR